MRLDSSTKNIVHEETRKLLSKNNSGINNPNYGNKWTDEQKKKMSEIIKKQFENNERKLLTKEDYVKIGEKVSKYWETHETEKLQMIEKVRKKNTIYKIYQYDKKTKELIKIWDCINDILIENPNYKKHNINPMSGCLFAFIQMPLFFAFLESLYRIPVVFEGNFIGFNLGTSPFTALFGSSLSFAHLTHSFSTGQWIYILLPIIVGLATFFSFKMNSTGNMQDPSMKMMPIMMSGMIIITALFMPSGLGIYWATSNLFTIVQNILVKRSKEVNGKA